MQLHVPKSCLTLLQRHLPTVATNPVAAHQTMHDIETLEAGTKHGKKTKRRKRKQRRQRENGKNRENNEKKTTRRQRFLQKTPRPVFFSMFGARQADRSLGGGARNAQGLVETSKRDGQQTGMKKKGNDRNEKEKTTNHDRNEKNEKNVENMI